MKSLIQKIKIRQAKIGIIGLGYVGLPLVIRFCHDSRLTIHDSRFMLNDSRLTSHELHNGKGWL